MSKLRSVYKERKPVSRAQSPRQKRRIAPRSDPGGDTEGKRPATETVAGRLSFPFNDLPECAALESNQEPTD